jgi:hypothetical protein
MKVVLTLEIDFDTSDYQDESNALSEVQSVLHDSVARMAGEGGFSGNTKATIDNWHLSTRVEETEDGFESAFRYLDDEE